MEIDRDACQCRYENLKAATTIGPGLMLQRAISYLKAHGLIHTVKRGLSFAAFELAEYWNRARRETSNSEAADSAPALMAEARSENVTLPGVDDRMKEEHAAIDAPGLQPGDLVEVKRDEEIQKTLDSKGRNKGLQFLPEMREFCGKRFRVHKRVERIIIETTGEIRRMKNTVLLEGVMCDGSAHFGCDRSCFYFWREIWLRRVDGSAPAS